MKSSLVEILTTALTETAGLLAGAFKKFFNVSTPTGTVNSIPDAVAGAAGGLFIAGTNAATTVTTSFTTTFTGSLTGSVGSVTGAVGSVTGAVGSVTGSVGSIASGGITTASFAAGAINAAALGADAITDAKVAADVTIASVTGAVGSVTGAVGSVTGSVGSVVGAVGSVTGNVGGNVTGSVGSVSGNVGGNVVGSTASVVGNVGGIAGTTQTLDALQTALNSAHGSGSWLTGSGTSTLTQADVRTAVGLAAANLDTQLGTLATPAQVNAEVVDAIATDTYAEPGQGTPAATLSLAAKIGYLFKNWRNKKTQTSTQWSLLNDDAVTVDQKSVVADDGTTASKNEVATGP